jgi:hypothetical protein
MCLGPRFYTPIKLLSIAGIDASRNWLSCLCPLVLFITTFLELMAFPITRWKLFQNWVMRTKFMYLRCFIHVIISDFLIYRRHNVIDQQRI